MATFKEVLSAAIEEGTNFKQAVVEKAPDEWPKSKADVVVALVQLGVPAGEPATSLAHRVWELQERPRRQLFEKAPKPPSRKNVEELIRAVAEDPQDRESVLALREKTAGEDLGQIFAVKDDGSIDPEASVQAYRHRDDLPKQPITGKVRGFFWRSLNALRGEKAWTDPFTEQRLSYFSDWYDVALHDQEGFAAIWWLKLYDPKSFKELGSAGLYAQYKATPPGEHIRKAKDALRSQQGEDQKRMVEQRLVWSEDTRKGDCDADKPFPSRR